MTRRRTRTGAVPGARAAAAAARRPPGGHCYWQGLGYGPQRAGPAGPGVRAPAPADTEPLALGRSVLRIWNSVPVSQDPLFLSYACHMPVIRTPVASLRHIFGRFVISLSIPASHNQTGKRYTTWAWYHVVVYPSVPNLKKLCQPSKRCTRYIPSVSFLVRNCMFLSYALHIMIPVITFSAGIRRT